MAVTGEVHPDRILTNAGLRAGQDLILTKPLGVGVLTTAIKADLATEDEAAGAVASMVLLNDIGARVAAAAGATGCTDVTGFGLLGHLGRMAVESGVRCHVDFGAIPFLPGSREHARAGIMPGGSRRNWEWGIELLDAGGYDEIDQLLFADAQTSGGLIFGVDPDRTADVLAELADTSHTAATIGNTADSSGQPGITLR